GLDVRHDDGLRIRHPARPGRMALHGAPVRLGHPSPRAEAHDALVVAYEHRRAIGCDAGTQGLEGLVVDRLGRRGSAHAIDEAVERFQDLARFTGSAAPGDDVTPHEALTLLHEPRGFQSEAPRPSSFYNKPQPTCA